MKFKIDEMKFYMYRGNIFREYTIISNFSRHLFIGFLNFFFINNYFFYLSNYIINF